MKVALLFNTPLSLQSAATKPAENVVDESTILQKITTQGDVVRNLKTQKADKSTIDAAVKSLLALKADYKSLTGNEWKPGTVSSKPQQQQQPAKVEDDEQSLLLKIAQQGDKVRDLKTKKAERAAVDPEVKTLLDLKAQYKSLTGKDWKPGAVPQQTSGPVQDESEVLRKIAEQGDKIRELKAQKAPKTAVEPEVKVLLDLKAKYKDLTGKEWKPGTVPQTPPSPVVELPSFNASLNLSASVDENSVLQQICEQGNKVRDLKAQKSDKSVIDAEVKKLLELKGTFKTLTGKDWKPDMKPTSTQSVCASGDSALKTDLAAKVTAQGDLVRNLKAAKAPKVSKFNKT